MHWVRRLVGAAIIVALVVGAWRFATENAERISVHYLWDSGELAIWQALCLAFAAGFALAAAGWLYFGVRSRLLLRRYRKTVGGLEAEVHQLRNLPLALDEPEGTVRSGLGRRQG